MAQGSSTAGAHRKPSYVASTLPEIVEDENLRNVIDIRTDNLQTLRELGPPDIVYLVKQSIKSANKQFGAYHHVTGIDSSSSASLAAYINTLMYSTQDKANKIVSGLYCCYNAFSRLDMRVQVKIPGTVESYCVNERGEQLEASEMLWLETYLCAILRAYSYSDSGNGEAIKALLGVRRFNPITSTEAEHKFFDAAEKLFFNGWSLGSDPEVQVPNVVSNHLTTGLLAYIKTTGRYTSAFNLFEKLRDREPDVASLLAHVYIAGDEEVRAVQLLHDSLQAAPMDYSLLACQASYLTSKNRSDLAIDIAKRGVIAAPSEFSTWAKLAETYVKLEQWDLALLTLNSCPMFTYQDRDAPKLPEPTRIYLPQSPETMCNEIGDGGFNDEMSRVPPALRRLGANNFKGTFQKAYMILTEISKRIGWDELLKIRSTIFVMEEEYRVERPPPTPHKSADDTSRSASTTAMRATDSPKTNGHSPTGSATPASATSRSPSLEDGRDETPRTALTLAGSSVLSEISRQTDPSREPASASSETPHRSALSREPDSAVSGVSRPSQLASTETSPVTPDHGNDAELPPRTPAKDSAHDLFSQLRHKRLCERWLDNLFMVLYEDLRIYTIWRTESAQSRQQQTSYRKSAEEWEILGQLAERLHHPDEALEAWDACLGASFSPRAMMSVLKHYETKKDTKGMLDALMRLIAWQCRWYSEFSPDLLRIVRELIEDDGELKVSSYVRSTTLPRHIQDLTMQYVDICKEFRSVGTDG